jgi:hypothetical protein
MKTRGRKKRGRLAAARRAASSLAAGELPLVGLIAEGMLAPATAPQDNRVRASTAERAHVERLRNDPGSWRPHSSGRG